MESTRLYLHPNVTYVSGYQRMCFYKFDSRRFCFSPLFIKEYLPVKGESSEIKLETEDEKKIIPKYFLENEIGIEFTKSDCFHKKDFTIEQDAPYLLTTLIVEVPCNREKLELFLNNILDFKGNVKQLIFIFNEGATIEYNSIILDKLEVEFQSYYRTESKDRIKEIEEYHKNTFIYATIYTSISTKDFFISEGVGVVRSFNNYYINFCNTTLFSESQKHHTYFNSKLYIGEKGEIKNAPECEEDFGNIESLQNFSELKEIINKPSFQKYWFVHKDKLDVCKDCEFRHTCLDNRLPYQRKDGSWYHKQECNYNPYICKWKGEEGYQTLEEIGVVVNENGYTIDDGKIAIINEKLWGE